jgi:GTP cyclohydrolase I
MGDVTMFSTEHYDQMIVVQGIEGYSLCEHHLLPFKFTAHVGYIPTLKILGLSKIPRIVEQRAHNLQNQERLTDEVATAIDEVSGAQGVIVVLEGWHTCVAMRGIQKEVTMTTSSLRGIFHDDLGARNEFFSHLRRSV